MHDPALIRSRRGWTWPALLSVSWAAALMELVSLEWVPDCGGVAYGMPLPYLRTFVASSITFDWFAACWLLDLLVYSAALLLPAVLIAQRVRRLTKWPRALCFTVLLVPAVWLPFLALLVASGAFPPSIAPSERLKVDHWHSVSLYFGDANWDSHSEPSCD